MGLSAEEFKSWCYRNGGETYGQAESPGVAFRFPDVETADRVTRLSETTFEVITDGQFYTTRSLHQRAESWIDTEDRLHIDTGDTRVIVDPP